ncbi:MAG: carboxypeptidase-like regulatory domain-containing protein [Segetibacter sp.]
MKITIIQIALSVLFASSLYAKEGKSQTILEKTFSLTVKEVELKEIILSIQEQTKVKFNFSENAINAERHISYSAKNTKIGAFLREVLKPYNIDYQVLNDQIILFPLKFSSLTNDNKNTFNNMVEQDQTVSGIVTSEKGETLSGVTVTEKGTTNAAITNNRGRYTIKVADNAVLVYTSIGYTSQQIPISGNAIINITLKTETSVTKVSCHIYYDLYFLYLVQKLL